MRSSAILLLALAVSAIGFFAGRASIPDSAPPIADPAQLTAPALPMPAPPARQPTAQDSASLTNPRALLLRAIRQPVSDRKRAIRLAMSAWLAADGGAAILATRKDPELAELAGRMIQLALYAYPEVFLDEPSLLDGIPDAERMVASAVSVLAMHDPDVAKALVESHLADSPYGDAMLAGIDQAGPDGSPLSIEDAYVELESILAERNQQRRNNRLHELVRRLAAQDPAAAAELIDRVPRSSMMSALGTLAHIWSESDPESAARWLADKNAVETQFALNFVARRWANSDFEAASAFLETLTGTQRQGFLLGLADAALNRPIDEALAWVARFEDERAYPQLVSNVAERLAADNLEAALGLIDTLPEEAQLAPYSSMLSQTALNDPEAAIAILDRIESEQVRTQSTPTIAMVWALNDPQAALDWALDLEAGLARDLAIAQTVNYLAQIDPERAIDVMAEFEEPTFRRSAVRNLVATLENENDAVRLGRDYDFDRDEVLEIRENNLGGQGFMLFPPISGPISAVDGAFTSFMIETE